MKVAIIPARGGSKRIPRKNVKLFCGKPIIAYSIAAALQSGCFDRVIVSTDDAEIAEVSRCWGAEVPFLRPAELSDDYIGTTPVVRHAINWCADQGQEPELACCIYATAPFVVSDDLCRGLDALIDNDCDYAFSVTSYPFPIQRAIRLTMSGHVEMFHPEYFNARSQDLQEAFHDAGQFYWGRTRAWKEGTTIFSPAAVAVRLPRYRVQDIDTEEDWARAELMYRAWQSTL